MDGPAQPPRLGWRAPLVVVAGYTAAAVLATFPVVTKLGSSLPAGLGDSLQALWVMRWYRHCLLHAQNPFCCPSIQYPVGAHLGNFSPLLLQSLLYLPLAALSSNDALCYNLIWLINLVFTGFGVFVLAWRALRDRACAAYAGLAAMLSAPVMLHAMGHLELITLGPLPLFAVAWADWVDRPGRKRLFLAAALYLLVALSAAYYAVFMLVPAALYPAWRVCRAGWPDGLGWLRRRLVPLAAFVAVTLPPLVLLFSFQIESHLGGHAQPRPRAAFEQQRDPPWTYVVPSRFHALHAVLPADPYQAEDMSEVASCSYLGVVVLGLIGYAALSRAGFDRRGFWWLLFTAFAVLSCGSYVRLGPVRVPLPAGWLRDWFPPFHFLRSACRFNLCAGWCGGVLAAAGLRQLLARVPHPAGRACLFAAVAALTVADLAVVPFRKENVPIPALPPCYAALRQRDPGAAFVEAPQFAMGLNAVCMYWQAQHQGRTSAGYSGFGDPRFDGTIAAPSPFTWAHFVAPDAWSGGRPATVDVVAGVDRADYAWLYLTVNHFDYVILHRDPRLIMPGLFLEDFERQFAPARVFSDDRTTVFARRRLPPPRHTTVLCTTGWRDRNCCWREQGEWREGTNAILSRVGHLAVYNPHPEEALSCILEAQASAAPRTVRLRSGNRELASWTVTPDSMHGYTSPPFRLPGGLSELVLESDGEGLPPPGERLGDGDEVPYSLRVARICLRPAATPAAPAPTPPGGMASAP